MDHPRTAATEVNRERACDERSGRRTAKAPRTRERGYPGLHEALAEEGRGFPRCRVSQVRRMPLKRERRPPNSGAGLNRVRPPRRDRTIILREAHPHGPTPPATRGRGRPERRGRPRAVPAGDHLIFPKATQWKVSQRLSGPAVDRAAVRFRLVTISSIVLILLGRATTLLRGIVRIQPP
jgi:hypothetical protein